jgi:hypothetical protein
MYAEVRSSGESLSNYVALLWMNLANPVLNCPRKSDVFLCLALISVGPSELPDSPMFFRLCRTYLL